MTEAEREAMERLPPRWEGFERRLPESLDELVGPATGEVHLPLHVAWSGRVDFDITRYKSRLNMYAIVLAEGQRADIGRFLNRQLLLQDWPILRSLVGPHVRRAWETRFSEFATA
jgi:hypothetical protein